MSERCCFRCGRGANAPKAAPEDGDIAKVVAHAHPDIEIFIPKVFEAKTVKEGGDPIMLKGPEAFETVIRSPNTALCASCSVCLLHLYRGFISRIANHLVAAGSYSDERTRADQQWLKCRDRVRADSCDTAARSGANSRSHKTRMKMES